MSSAKSEKFTYTNFRGDVYFLRQGKSGRGKGVQIICSKQYTDDALEAVPEGMELVESPNGEVSCRKKQKSTILPAERQILESWIPILKRQALVKIEATSNALIVHGADATIFSNLGLPARSPIMEKIISYQPFFCFELESAATRTFTIFWHCFFGEGRWVYLDSGSIEELAEKYLPHVAKKSFFGLL